MKFEKFLKSKGISFEAINENADNRLYEADGGPLEAIMKNIKSMMSYAKFQAMAPKYEDACYNADSNIIAFSNFSKQQALDKKILALGDAKEGADRAKKEQIIKQIDKLKEVKDQLDSQIEVKQERANQERDKMKTEIDELMSDMTDSLKTVASKKLTLASYEAKLAGLEKKGIMDKAAKDPERESKTKEELNDLKTKRDEAIKALDDAENAGESDIKEVEGTKAYMTEINAFVDAAKKVAVEKVTLGKLRDEADGHVFDSLDVDALLSYNPSRILEDDNIDADYSIDEKSDAAESANKATPSDVLSKINAIKDKDENDKDQTDVKKTLYGKLAAAAERYITAVKAQVEAKKALWDKVKGKPATKDLIEVAGGNPEEAKEQKDGSYICDKASDKWGVAFDTPEEYGPLKNATEAATEAKDKAGSSEPKEETETETETNTKPEGETETETETEKELTDEQKEKLQKAEAGLQKAKDAGDEEKTKRWEALIDKIKSGKKMGESEEHESFWSSIDEELNSLISEESTPAPAPTKTIMKFADFLASRNN